MKLKKRKLTFLIVITSSLIISSALSLTSCTWNVGSRVRLITNSGSIIDKSFNEMAYDALADITNTAAPSQKHWYKPTTNLPNSIAEGYRAAEATGAKYILAPGFQQIAAIYNYCSSVPKTKLKWIVVDSDGTLDSPSGRKVVGNRVAGIIFNIKVTAYIGGFYSAYRAQEFDKPIVGTYGGGDWPGVTDYNLGWLAGVKGANAFNAQNKTINWKPVGIAKFFSPGQWTDSGFEKQQIAMAKTRTLLSLGANMIMPVAGADTLGTLSEIRTEHSKALVLGVDTDMSKQFPKYKNKFFTSIMKNITYAMDSTYLKDVKHIDKIDKNSTNRAAQGFFKRFGKQDQFLDKAKAIDLSNSKIQPFGTNTFGNLENHFTGMAKLNWGGAKSPLTLPGAMAFLNTENSRQKNGKTKWENQWLEKNKSVDGGLTWDNFLILSVLKNWNQKI